jgi:hypothetical protein
MKEFFAIIDLVTFFVTAWNWLMHYQQHVLNCLRMLV